MTIATTTEQKQKVWTDAAFMALSDDGHQYEVVNGELVDMGNSGMEHGWIASILNGVMFNHVFPRKLGVICDSSTAFAMKNGNKRAPDVSFIAKNRLTGMKRLPKGYFQGAPDLAVEILSPNNTVEEIHEKIVEYFDNGTQLLWVIHPDEQFVLVYHGVSPDKLLQVTDTLDGEQIIPGFSMPVANLFVELDF